MKKTTFLAVLVMFASAVFAQEGGDPVSVSVDPEGGIDVRITVEVISNQQNDQPPYDPQQYAQQQYAQQQYPPQQQYAQQQQYPPQQQQNLAQLQQDNDQLQQQAAQQQQQVTDLQRQVTDLQGEQDRLQQELDDYQEREALANAPLGAPEFFDLEVTVGMPVHWTNSPFPHEVTINDAGDTTYESDKKVTANTALGVGLLFNISRRFGFTIDADLFFGGNILADSTTSSNDASQFGANALVGPVIFLYNGASLRVPLALGAHLYYWSEDFWFDAGDNNAANPNNAAPISSSQSWLKTTEMQLGLGAYIGVQYHFNDSYYLFSRTNVSVDFYRIHDKVTRTAADPYSFSIKVDGDHANDGLFGGISWGVKPTLGVGIKY